MSLSLSLHRLVLVWFGTGTGTLWFTLAFRLPPHHTRCVMTSRTHTHTHPSLYLHTTCAAGSACRTTVCCALRHWRAVVRKHIHLYHTCTHIYALPPLALPTFAHMLCFRAILLHLYYTHTHTYNARLLIYYTHTTIPILSPPPRYLPTLFLPATILYIYIRHLYLYILYMPSFPFTYLPSLYILVRTLHRCLPLLPILPLLPYLTFTVYIRYQHFVFHIVTPFLFYLPCLLLRWTPLHYHTLYLPSLFCYFLVLFMLVYYSSRLSSFTVLRIALCFDRTYRFTVTLFISLFAFYLRYHALLHFFVYAHTHHHTYYYYCYLSYYHTILLQYFPRIPVTATCLLHRCTHTFPTLPVVDFTLVVTTYYLYHTTFLPNTLCYYHLYYIVFCFEFFTYLLPLHYITCADLFMHFLPACRACLPCMPRARAPFFSPPFIFVFAFFLCFVLFLLWEFFALPALPTCITPTHYPTTYYFPTHTIPLPTTPHTFHFSCHTFPYYKYGWDVDPQFFW